MANGNTKTEEVEFIGRAWEVTRGSLVVTLKSKVRRKLGIQQDDYLFITIRKVKPIQQEQPTSHNDGEVVKKISKKNTFLQNLKRGKTQE